MAKRKQLFHPDEVKKKIQTSQLINRLQDNAFADEEFLSTGQISSINSLLDRVVPKLKAIEHSGTGENGEIIFQTVYEIKK
jgi:hypothetical protein